MAYTMVNCSGAEYAVDWEVLERFSMSYWQTHHQLRCAETIRMSESSWYNPFSWSLPEIQTVDVDWEAARSAARIDCTADMLDYSHRAGLSMPDIAQEIKFRVEQTAIQRRAFTNLLKSVQANNLSAMNNAVDDYTGLIDAMKFIRNTSADIVAVGSTIATGGAAAGLLGASASMKGFGKYQDTGKVGASVLYGAGSLVLGAFKIGGAKLTKAGEYTLIVVQGALESGTSLAAGDSFANAVSSGGLKVASAGAAQALFGASWVKNIFAKMPIPINVWSKMQDDGVNKMFVDEAKAVAEKTAKKFTEKGVKSGIQAAAAPAASHAFEARTLQTGYLDQVPIEDTLLLNLSIVNMAKGIGHGW